VRDCGSVDGVLEGRHPGSTTRSESSFSTATILADHPDWSYRKLAFNRFVIGGPATDPAAAAKATDAVDAFRRIAAAGAFVSLIVCLRRRPEARFFRADERDRPH
jgi:hypothetical protein